MAIDTTTSVDVQTLTPFKKFIMTIGALPTSYLESMTYAELLMWFCNYLQETVIPTVNNNALAVEELQGLYEELKTYVNNYFENLNVQDEINLKLDNMASDGSLTNLIKDYIDPIQEEFENSLTTQVNNDINAIRIEVESAVSGTPLVASSTAGMTDTEKIYINTSDGYWYYYNGTAWTQGGEYIANIENYVQKDGVGQITPQNIENNIKLNSSYFSDNIFNTDVELLYEDKLVTIWNDAITYSNNTDYNTYIMKLDKNSDYYNCNAPFRTLVKTESDQTTPTGALESYNYYFTTTNNDIYAIFSIKKEYATIIIKKKKYNYSLNNVIKVYEKNLIQDNKTPAKISDNLLPLKEMYNVNGVSGSSKYLASIDNLSHKIYLSDSGGSYNTYISKVESDTYYFNNVRYVVLLDSDQETAIGTIEEYPTSISTGNASYIAYSVRYSEFENRTAYMKMKLYDNLLPYNTILNTKRKNYFNNLVIPSFSGSTSASNEIYHNVKDKYIYSFKADITSFSSLTINFVDQNLNESNYITINGSKIVANNSYITPEEINHGLTISNNIYFSFELLNSKIKLYLESNGESFSIEKPFTYLTSKPIKVVLTNGGSTLTNLSINDIFLTANKDLWIFGDSYFTLDSTARWTHYLLENYGLSHLLINGAPGSNSNDALICLQNLLKFERPKKVLIATGMNDGSDTDSISSNYQTNINAIINLLKSYQIEIILTTIPSVPSISHQYKNAFVKNSGYRFIDFADAVGAQNDGTWFTGMLSSDNVHPTEKGAKALYVQAINDLPELLN